MYRLSSKQIEVLEKAITEEKITYHWDLENGKFLKDFDKALDTSIHLPEVDVWIRTLNLKKRYDLYNLKKSDRKEVRKSDEYARILHWLIVEIKDISADLYTMTFNSRDEEMKVLIGFIHHLAKVVLNKKISRQKNMEYPHDDRQFNVALDCWRKVEPTIFHTDRMFYTRDWNEGK